MRASRAAPKKDPDQRLLVLLLFGLTLCLGPLLAPFLPSKVAQTIPVSAYLWLTGIQVPEGLYRLAPDSWPSGMGHSYGLGALPAASAIDRAAISQLAAFELEAGVPPVPVRLPVGLAPFFFAPIAVNQADRELLMTLPGIGPRLADAIIAFRQQKKKINHLSELLEVRGIGKVKIAKLQDRVSFE